MPIQIIEIPSQKLACIRPLFRQVFGSDISEEMLAWKYGAGRGRSYGAFNPGGELLAHCGIFYRQVLADGQPRRIAQLGDLMALPGGQGGLSRARTPFALLIQQILAGLPDDANPDALAFGFPSDRAMRLGEHLGLFSSIDRMWELTFTPMSLAWYADRCVEIMPDNRNFEDNIARLWRQMADDLGSNLIGRRDAAYVRQRYFGHPHNRYRCHLVLPRWRSRPLGLLITRIDRAQCELLDLVASRSNMGRVLRAARQQLGGWGVAAMKLWLTEQHATTLQHLATDMNRLEFRIMANPSSSGSRPERFAGRWWLTSGDTDYH